MAHHEEKYLDFCAARVLGTLDGEELKEFEGHLRWGCAICGGEIAILSEAASLLPLALAQVTVSPELRELVLFDASFAKVTKAMVQPDPGQTPPEPEATIEAAPRVRRTWMRWGLAFGVIALLVGLSPYINLKFRSIGAQSEYIRTQQAQIAKLIDELERKDAILKVLESRKIEIVTMDGQEVNPSGFGSIIWDPVKKLAILHVSNLPAVPEGKEYQLWVIKDQIPVSAGIFAVTSNMEEESYFRVQPLEVADRKQVDAFTVTLEPKGGVPRPTGAMYLLGKASAQ